MTMAKARQRSRLLRLNLLPLLLSSLSLVPVQRRRSLRHLSRLLLLLPTTCRHSRHNCRLRLQPLAPVRLKALATNQQRQTQTRSMTRSCVRWRWPTTWLLRMAVTMASRCWRRW